MPDGLCETCHQRPALCRCERVGVPGYTDPCPICGHGVPYWPNPQAHEAHALEALDAELRAAVNTARRAKSVSTTGTKPEM